MKSTFINAIFGHWPCVFCLSSLAFRPKKPLAEAAISRPESVAGPSSTESSRGDCGEWDNWSLVVLSNSRGFSEISSNEALMKLIGLVR